MTLRKILVTFRLISLWNGMLFFFCQKVQESWFEKDEVCQCVNIALENWTVILGPMTSSGPSMSSGPSQSSVLEIESG